MKRSFAPSGHHQSSAQEKVTKAVRAAIASQVKLPPGVYIDYAGTAARTQAAQRQLLFNIAIALVTVVAVLLITFGDGRAVGLILASAPFALVGGVVAIAFDWGGADEMDKAHGAGCAELQDDGSLLGEITFYNGDESGLIGPRMRDVFKSLLDGYQVRRVRSGLSALRTPRPIGARAAIVPATR